MGIFSRLFGGGSDERPQWMVADGALVYAIGDVHGRMDLLSLLMEKIERDLQARSGYTQAYLVPLGDYVDRGFESADVVDYFANFKHDVLQLVPLIGNHELLMAQFIDEPETGPMWFSVGGLAAMKSYGVHGDMSMGIMALRDAAKALDDALPEHHRDFLGRLKLSWQSGDYFFVHAGIRPKVALEDQKRSDLVGIRADFTEYKKDHGVCVVHGHTGVDDVTILNNRIAVDTGAFATGKLSAVALQGAEVSVLIG